MGKKKNIYKLSETLISNLEHTARISKILAVRFFDEHEDINITFHEFVIIDALYMSPNLHQRDLAKMLYKGTANLSRDLEKLEKRGLIKRVLETKDRRVVKTLMLTPAGEKMYNELIVLVRKHIEDIQSIFSPEEYNQFMSFILRLRGKLTSSNSMIFE